jgi:hypothetical protein
MYDSTNPFDIPVTAEMVGGYVDGSYAWSAAGWARFPNAVHVPISIYSSRNNGIVLDVEPGCTWPPANSVAWVQRRRASGVDPTIYCNQQNSLHLVQAAFQAAGVAEPHYWTAAYPGIGKALYAGTVAHQYANPLTSGGHFDLSVTADVWPGVDTISSPGGTASGTIYVPPAPAFPSTTPTMEDSDMRDLVAALYRKYLGREGSTIELDNQAVALAKAGATPAQAVVNIGTSKEAVEHAYATFLGRAPSAGDIAFWLGLGAGDPDKIVSGISTSAEAVAFAAKKKA